VNSIADVVARHGVIICAGSGGVGKTSTAAALAVYGAQQGRRTCVLTIDPARRLADALGLRMLGNEESTVNLAGKGTLSALMLDQKGAWDQLVERYAPSAEVRDRIFRNPFYQNLSGSFAGSQEYMAVEQLAALHASKRYDLIVVDTPPTRHALDFLDAPQRIADFLDRRIVRWFVKPYFSAGWATLRIVNRTAGTLLRRLEDATGVSALVDISDFFTSMSGLFDGFGERVAGVQKLLRSPSTAFVLVTTPEEQVLSEAEYFCGKVRELSIPLRAVVFNRVHREALAGLRSFDERWLRGLVEKSVRGAERAEKLVRNFLRYEIQARGDQLRIESFREQLPARTAVATVPNFEEDLHDLAGLGRMIPYLVKARDEGKGAKR
jgi:anion-transporting  ArsA/GET3 family ATPase